MPPEIVAEVVAPVPGTPEHDAAMIAKVDESAAKSLEASGGAAPVAPVEAPAVEPVVAKVDEPIKAPEDAPQGDAEKAVEAAGLDYTSLQSEWEAGGLTEESYKALEKVGFGKDIVDQHIAGQAALAQIVIMQAEATAGGKESLAAMQDWAKTGMTDAERASYNKAVMGTQEDMTQAILGLKSRYESEYGKQPGLLGGRNTSGGMEGYGSRAEMTAEMRDPRYTKDSAFRAKVMAKVSATTAF